MLPSIFRCLLRCKCRKIIVLIGIVVALYLVRFVPVWVDYPQFRDSARAVVNGQNPYDAARGFYNPPWLIPLMIPFAMQDDATGNGLLFLTGFVAFAFVAILNRATIAGLILFLVSPAVIASQTTPNIDWLPLLGMWLTPSVGVLLLAIKPQVGIGAILIIALIALKQKTMFKTFAPLAILSFASFVFYDSWFMRSVDLPSKGWNVSLFPYSLILGVPLFVWAIWKHDKVNATASTILCSPYVSNPSWSGAFLALVRYPILLAIASIAYWIWRIYASS